MFRNYIKIAFRNLRRNSVYSFINIFGLSLGLTCSFLLFLFIDNELSFDAFHSNASKIARVIEIDKTGEEPRSYGRTSALTGPALLGQYAEVVNQTRLFQPFGHIDIHWKGDRISERKWAIADSTFFEIFDFEFLEGDRHTALSEPNSIVLSKGTATKYFGEKSALNEVMEFNSFTAKVTGVIEDMPSNSQLDLEVVISKNVSFDEWSWWQRAINSWDIYFASTYVELASETGLDYLQEQSEEFIFRNRGEVSDQHSIDLQPLRDVYLESDLIEGGMVRAKGSWFTIYIFGAIAFFLILMACINYINLATAKSMQRAKEIGTRKVSGATQNQLIVQFLSEAMIISVIAFLISLLTIDLVLPYFNQLIDSDITVETFSGRMIGLLFGISLLVGILAGSYPALYLSRLQPSAALKSNFKGTSTVYLRKSLVIVQFALSIFMIVATIVVSRQMNFISNKSLGFDKE